ncbi:MAG TPA: hypothetical protein VD963_06110 [Phycisphaerales bacterium]|nr:hypothetical protein [Phycisphaerales bacterium]
MHGGAGRRAVGMWMGLVAATWPAPGCAPSDPGAQARRPLPTRGVIGGLGELPGQFGYPRAIEADASGLWVVDKTGRVQRLDPETGRCLAWWRMPDSQVGKPVGVTVAPGPEGTPALWVADTHYSRVLVYALDVVSPAGPDPRMPGEATPRLITSFGSFGEGPGQFVYPTDVAVVARRGPGGRVWPERVYVSEYGGHDRVSCFDGELAFQFSFGHYGAGRDLGAPEFDRPQSLALVPGAGPEPPTLLVADSRNHRLGRFDLDGRLLGWLGEEAGDDAAGTYRYPYGLCALEDGTVLVAEFGANRVQRIEAATGASLGAWGVAGRGPGELATPWGVAVHRGWAYVLDSGNNRVQRFVAPAGAAVRW